MRYVLGAQQATSSSSERNISRERYFSFAGFHTQSDVLFPLHVDHSLEGAGEEEVKDSARGVVLMAIAMAMAVRMAKFGC